jgi:uncharacterized protein YqgC (DUF456 family)
MPVWLESTLFWVILLIMLGGLGGLIIPIFPGIVVIWLAALGYGVASSFGTLGIVFFTLITLLMIAGVTVDNLLMGVEARQRGAPWLTLLIGAAAGILGTLLIPPIGGLITAPLVILLLEYHRRGDWQSAIQTLRALVLGWSKAFIARFAIGVLMVVFWLIWAISK